MKSKSVARFSNFAPTLSNRREIRPRLEDNFARTSQLANTGDKATRTLSSKDFHAKTLSRKSVCSFFE